MVRSSRSLVLLLLLTVVLAGGLAYEAQRATRSHQVTAERALRDYATVAARELATATDEALEALVGPALNPVVGSPAASPYDPLPPPAAIAPATSGLLPCAARGYRADRVRPRLPHAARSRPLAAAPDRGYRDLAAVRRGTCPGDGWRSRGAEAQPGGASRCMA